MKKLSLLIALLLVICLNYSCKKCIKLEEPNLMNCGCNTSTIKYSLLDITGTLSYFANKSKWVFSYQPLPGNYSNYFPCNTTQDSLKAILLNASTSQTFNVKFTGKVKSSCPDEDFGVTSGVTTFDYIVIDSLKRK